MVYGEFPCCLVGGHLDSVGAVVCLVLLLYWVRCWDGEVGVCVCVCVVGGRVWLIGLI
jgi:hypothetical protein